jgi:hypothetical protein
MCISAYFNKAGKFSLTNVIIPTFREMLLQPTYVENLIMDKCDRYILHL